jgi:hypothetical protein
MRISACQICLATGWVRVTPHGAEKAGAYFCRREMKKLISNIYGEATR